MIDEGGSEEREADWRPLQRVEHATSSGCRKMSAFQLLTALQRSALSLKLFGKEDLLVHPQSFSPHVVRVLQRAVRANAAGSTGTPSDCKGHVGCQCGAGKDTICGVKSRAQEKDVRKLRALGEPRFASLLQAVELTGCQPSALIELTFIVLGVVPPWLYQTVEFAHLLEAEARAKETGLPSVMHAVLFECMKYRDGPLSTNPSTKAAQLLTCVLRVEGLLQPREAQQLLGKVLALNLRSLGYCMRDVPGSGHCCTPSGSMLRCYVAFIKGQPPSLPPLDET